MTDGPILTLIVAAYNVEGYIRQTLDSLRGVDGIEVLVIDDGATDGTRVAAEPYAEADPATFRIVHKDNGGYGTVVNLGVREARGTYVKLLDGDDWMRTEALRRLVSAMAASDADLFVMPRLTVREGGQGEGAEASDAGELPFTQGSPVNLSGLTYPLGHWHLAVRTQALRARFEPLPGKTLYTDQLFVEQALMAGGSVAYFAEPVYCYRVGREGQSVSRESRIRHLADRERVTTLGNALLFKDGQNGQAVDCCNQAYVLHRVATYYAGLIHTLLLPDPSRAGLRRLKGYEGATRDAYPVVFETAGRISRRVRLTRAFGYLGYWAASAMTRDSWS